MLLSLASCGEESKVVETKDEAGWFTTWTSAQLTAGPDETPFDPALKENTCRQQIRVSIGGEKIRLTLSNEYGDIPVNIEGVRIAHLLDPNAPAIDASTDTAVTFGGANEVTMRRARLSPRTK